MELLIAIVIAVVAVFAWKSFSKKPPPSSRGSNGAEAAPELSGITLSVTQPRFTFQDGGPDAWEEWDYMGTQVAANGKELARRLRIHFTDKEGQKTEREIDTKRFITDGKDGLIYAHCHLRNANRPFRLSRVSQAVNLETGESLADLPSWLSAQYAESPKGMADRFINEHGDALSALFYVAKADGAFRQAERTRLSEFCAGIGVASAETMEAVLQDVGAWATPTAIGFGKALRAIACKPEDYRRRVLGTAKLMIESDKTRKDDEVNALARMTKELGLKGT